jgi:hypothetical protein
MARYYHGVRVAWMVLVAHDPGAAPVDAFIASMDGVVDAGVSDAAAPADSSLVPGVACGDYSCGSNADQFCDPDDYGVTGTCRAHTAPMYKGYGCDGPEDCPTAACCLNDYGSACSALGYCDADGRAGLWMCHQDPECGVGFVGRDVAPGGRYRVCKPSC